MPDGLISLTFDDGLHEHLDIAAGILNEAHLPATFYVHLAADSLIRRKDEWASLAGQGHEIGNHTVFHPAIGTKSWVSPGAAIEGYSLDRMRIELQLANDWLSSIDGQTSRSFAYPCSNTRLGRPTKVAQVASRLASTRLSSSPLRRLLARISEVGTYDYRTVASKLSVAARAGGLRRGDTPPPLETWNRWSLYSLAVNETPLAELCTFADVAIESESWAIFQFHGIGGGHGMNCNIDTFRQLCLMLSNRHPDRIVTIREGSSRVWGHAELSPGTESGGITTV